MSTLSERDEEKLLQGVKRAAELVESGLHPGEAMTKAAKELGYTPGFLKIACNAFNTGRQNAQWNSGESILDKLASVALVSYDDVADNLWGKKAADEYQGSHQAIAPTTSSTVPVLTYNQMFSDWRLSSPTFAGGTQKQAEQTKTAQECRAESAGKTADKFRNLKLLRQKMERARTEKAAAQNKFNVQLHNLYSYFRQSPEMRASLESVKSAAVAYRGEVCSHLFDYVEETVPAKLLQGGHTKTANWKQAPFCYVDRLLQAGKSLASAATEYDQIAEKYASLYEELHPTPAKPKPRISAEIDLGLFKSAAGLLGGVLGAGAYGAAKSTLDSLKDSEDKKLEKYVTSLDSPDHMDEMRKIRAQVVLSELMSDPDSPISGYDPDLVAREYNNIVDMSPRLADQPSVISSLLNKRLVGNVEPFELSETLKLEEGLKKTQAPVAEKPRDN